MFQYAAARRLALKHDTSVLIDTTWYDRIPTGATHRLYELDKLQISGTVASRWQLIGTDGLRNTRLTDIPVGMYRKIRPRFIFVPEQHFHFDPEVLELPDNVCLFGYWVSERYFSDCANVIREEFRFRAPPSIENQAILADLQASESVAIHVRRGDYASDPNIASIHGLCSLAYYLEAVMLLRSKLHSPEFFVFSDDLDWARDNLDLGADARYIDHNRGEYSPEDLRLMSHARHIIISNSGFSWWGAWLGYADDKIVVAPSRWMANRSFNTSDVIPPSWHVV